MIIMVVVVVAGMVIVVVTGVIIVVVTGVIIVVVVRVVIVRCLSGGGRRGVASAHGYPAFAVIPASRTPCPGSVSNDLCALYDISQSSGSVLPFRPSTMRLSAA